METIKSYVFRVIPRGVKSVVFREIRLDGYYTLHDLNACIEKAFLFYGTVRQYMFSTDNIPYDTSGYYHPDSVEGLARDGSKATIDSLNLKVNDSILYIYDFGHNTTFDIIVIDICKVETKYEPIFVAGQGHIFVYPDDPDEGVGFLKDFRMSPVSFRVQEDEYCFHENLLQANGSCVQHMVSIFLGCEFGFDINKPKVCMQLSKFVKASLDKLYNLIYADAFSFLRDLFMHNVTEGSLNRELINHIYLLGSLGFIDVSIEPGEGGDRLILYIPSDHKDFCSVFDSKFDEEIERRRVLDRSMNMILDLYGVIEDDRLITYLKDWFDIDVEISSFSSEILFPRIVDKSAYILIKETVNFVSRYCVEDIMRIFRSRAKLEGIGYKEFTKEELNIVSTVGIKGLVKNFGKFVKELSVVFNVDKTSVADVVERALTLRTKGTDIIEIKMFIQNELDINWENITPRIIYLFSNVMNDCPMHNYRGYSFSEACYITNL